VRLGAGSSSRPLANPTQKRMQPRTKSRSDEGQPTGRNREPGHATIRAECCRPSHGFLSLVRMEACFAAKLNARPTTSALRQSPTFPGQPFFDVPRQPRAGLPHVSSSACRARFGSIELLPFGCALWVGRLSRRLLADRATRDITISAFFGGGAPGRQPTLRSPAVRRQDYPVGMQPTQGEHGRVSPAGSLAAVPHASSICFWVRFLARVRLA
jgi:hypothetical protein